jgi:DNA repair protein RadC
MVSVDHKGHRDRLKTRFLNEGLDSFSSHQVLELLLFYAIPYKDTNGYAHQLLDEYGSLSGVFSAGYDELASMKGIGPHAATLLKLAPELARVYSKDRWREKTQIRNVKDAGTYAMSLFVGMEKEAVFMICLNAQNRVITNVLIDEGTVNEATVYPRKVIEHALRHNSVTVILAHNHPSGSYEPSAADVDMTKKITAALKVIPITVMDHIIVAGGKYLSMAERQLL